MSETVHYKGVLRKKERFEGENFEDHCKRLLDNKELPSHFSNYEEFLLDRFYGEIIIYKEDIYQVEREHVDPEEGIFNASLNENGDISFEVRYYNGGCGFDEAIEEAIEKINK